MDRAGDLASAMRRVEGVSEDSERSNVPATLDAIAQMAHVSTSTVSKVLNRRDGVGPETRGRVAALLEHHHVAPRARGKRLRHIVAVCGSIMDPETGQFLHGLTESVGASADVVVRLVSDVTQGRLLRETAGAQGTGFVLFHARIDPRDHAWLVTRGVRIVDAHSEEFAATVSTGHAAGGSIAFRHLVELGHRQIALLIDTPSKPGWQSVPDAAARWLASEATGAMLVVVEGETGAGAELPSVPRLLGVPHGPTAVVTRTAPVALSLLRAAKQRRIAVPEALSVMALEDSPAAARAVPAVTAVAISPRALGRLAYASLVAQSREPLLASWSGVSPLLIRRGSTGPAPHEPAAGPVRRG